MKKVVNHALKHNNIVGGWLNSEDGYYYFDSTKIFEDSKLDEAIQFAKENEQTAVYDLTNQKEILVSEYNVLKSMIQQIQQFTFLPSNTFCIKAM